MVGWLLARRQPLRLGAVVAVAVVVQALPLAAPLLLSKDAYTYWAQARVAVVHHANPYVTAPSAFPRDPALPYVSQSWLDSHAVYGPAWEAVGTLPALAAGSSAHRAELGYRALAVLAMLALVAAVAAGSRSGSAVAVLGWNPLVALHFAGGGHNDAWMMALVVFALLGGRLAGAPSAAAWVLASAVKPVPLVLLPLELARTRLRRSKSFWLGLGVAAAVVVAAGIAAFGGRWLGTATVAAHESSAFGGVHWLGEAGLRHRDAVLVAGLAFAALYALLLVDAWRTRTARLSVAATALCLAISQLRPWYALWPVALAASEDDLLAGLAASGLTAYLLLGDAIRI